MNDYKEMVEAFFNGELTKEEEMALFTGLATNNEAKDYFRKSNFLKAGMELTKCAVPVELDKKIANVIFNAGKERSDNFRINIQTVITYALSVAFLILSFLFYSIARDYKRELKEARSTIQYQRTTLKVLMNSLPPVNIKENIPNEIIINKKL